MALDDLLISTGVDNLIKLVHERGKIELKAAAAALRLPVQTVEDWGHVLETEGIIKIQYQLTSVYLVWASMVPAQFEQTSRAIEAKKSETVQKIQALGGAVDQGLGELDELKSEFSALQQKTRTELDALSKDRAEAERLGRQADELIGSKQEKLNALRAQLAQFGADLAAFDASSKKRGAAKSGEADQMAQLDTLAKSEERLNERIRSTTARFDDMQEQIHVAQAQLASDDGGQKLEEAKSALADLRFASQELGKSAEGLRHEIQSLQTETENLASRIGEAEKQKTGKVNPRKTMAALSVLDQQASRERDAILGELNKNLAVVRKQMEAYSQAQYQYQNIRTQLESLHSQYAHESEELDQFLGALDSAYRRYVKDLAGAKGSLGDTQKDYERMMSKAQRIEDVLGRVEALRSEGETLSVKLKGVLREAQVVAMAAPPGTGGLMAGAGSGASGAGSAPDGGGGPGAAGAGGFRGGGEGGGGMPALPSELAQRIALTTKEEEQFEKKREELRWLIRRMWDDDRKGPSG